jgi:Zn-dependent peptidase ImmA (M78 family)
VSVADWSHTGHNDLLRVDGSEGFEVFLSPVTSYLEDNFSIARALGHLFLHRPTFPVLKHSKDTQVSEANQFGYAFLMPKSEILRILSQGMDPQAMMREFEVGWPRLENRISQIKNMPR